MSTEQNPKEPLPLHLDPTTYPRTFHNPDSNIHIELTYSPLSPTTLISHTRSPSAGANVLFLGSTRNSFDSRPVSHLSYTTYAPLALRTLTTIAEEAVRNHALLGISIAHRLGTVPIMEDSIGISVSAEHRGAAWRAGEEVLERCKEKVEIWKREEFADEEGGGEWRANKDTDGEGNILK
jgi:molybdopterin synthase catalytic subunit